MFYYYLPLNEMSHPKDIVIRHDRHEVISIERSG